MNLDVWWHCHVVPHSRIAVRLQWTCSDAGFRCLGRRLLILGDGNLSFSVALACARPEAEITATVFEDEYSFELRYPSAAEMLIRLRSLFPRVKVLFGIDARNLPLRWMGRFDDIIWNFPHPGGKTNIRKSRELMRAVFESVSRIIRDGKFLVTLVRGQSGLDHEAIVKRRFLKRGCLPAHRLDSWQIAYLAAEWNFSIENVRQFDPRLFPLYSVSGYRNRDQVFHNSFEAELITFVLSPSLNTLKAVKLHEEEQYAVKEVECFHELRPYFKHDLSILYEETTALGHWESVFLNLVREACGSLVVAIEEVEHLRSFAPNGLPNRIYRLTWQAWRKPLSKALCNMLQEELRSLITSAVLQRKLKIVLT